MMARTKLLAGLYVITNHQHCHGRQLLSDVESALRGGARVIQYRDKSADSVKRLREAGRLVELGKRYKRTVIINDDIALAKQVQADGVHLGGEDEAIETARRQLGENALIGVSCYNQLDRAIDAAQKGADYVAFGRFYASSTKPGDIYASNDLLMRAKQQINIPIVAIGGISYENAAPLIQSGADMLAVVNAVFGQNDIEQSTCQLQLLFEKQDS